MSIDFFFVQSESLCFMARLSCVNRIWHDTIAVFNWEKSLARYLVSVVCCNMVHHDESLCHFYVSLTWQAALQTILAQDRFAAKTSAALHLQVCHFAALVGSTHCWGVFHCFYLLSSVIVICIDDWSFSGQKDRIGRIVSDMPYTLLSAKRLSQMFTSQYRHGQGMMVPNFSWSRLCSALSGPWQHMTSGGLRQQRLLQRRLLQQRLLQPRRPKPPEQLPPQWRHWKQPSKRRSKENFFQRDQRMEKLPRWDSPRKERGVVMVLWYLLFGQVSICFNLQFRDDITMWIWCRQDHAGFSSVWQMDAIFDAPESVFDFGHVQWSKSFVWNAGPSRCSI